MKNIVIFASGTGTNAKTIIDYFENSQTAQVTLVVSNKGTAPVLLKAALSGVPAMILDKREYFDTKEFVAFLQKQKTDLIVLAGFLLLVPKMLLEAFPDKIINVHPALLPAYGGKGMYGMRVCEEILKNKEKESGITFHYVNENFDEGKIIFQQKCMVDVDDTPESLSQKNHALEHKYYPQIIEQLLKK